MNGSGEKEIEFTFTQRNGGTRKRKMVLKVWYLTLTVVTMNLPLNIHAK